MTETSTLASPAPPQVQPPARRLLSLDALRGFDMFWIVGGEEVVHALYKALPFQPFKFLETQMDHVPWRGVHFYDLIFPLFVFIVGISIVFSLTRAIERDGKAVALKRIFLRSLIIYTWGLIVYGGLSAGIDHVRWMGVLQRIALCYFFTALLFCAFRLKGLLAVCVALLLGYWALVSFVPIRNFNIETKHLLAIGLTPSDPETMVKFKSTSERVTGAFEDGLCLPQHFDFQFLPGHRWDGAYDPEGILSTLPAVATCLLGVFTGLLLRSSQISNQKKVSLLIIAGAAGLVVGYLWSFQFPIIKKIWTSSYVLVAGGFSCLFVAAFYQMIEIWQWRKRSEPFVWIGTNAITIYLLFHLIKFGDYAERVAGGPVERALGNWGSLLLALVVVGMTLAIVRFLYIRKIFLRF